MSTLRAVLLLLLLGLLPAACGTNQSGNVSEARPSASASATSSASITAGRSTTAGPADTATTSVGGASGSQTATPTLDVPTPAPTITAAPSATAFPLEAGWWDNSVCYEVFVRSFYDSDGDGNGDINGLIEKLDYISDGDPGTRQDLGANCVWLMPITEAQSYHGYDVVDYYKVEQDYGTNEDFKRLTAEAHKRGIKIILDLVLNHTSSRHPWFLDAQQNPESPYRNWYIWSKDNPGYKGPWGDVAWQRSKVRDEYYYGVFWEGMPDLNYRNPAVTEEAHKISAFWLNEMGADGFRLDAIKHLIENGKIQENTPETHAWLRDYRAFLRQIDPDAFTIGEIFAANVLTLKSYYPDQLDAYFVFDIGQQLISAANSGSAIAFTLTAQNAFKQLPFQRFAPFLTNHDQERVMTTLGEDPGRAKIAATALLTLPGLPFVYYGEEIGMVGTKPDERLRTPMQWTAAPNGGFSSGRPWEALQNNHQAVNVAAQESDQNSLLQLYRHLIHLHTSEPAIGTGSFTLLKSSNPRVAGFVRQAGADAVLVVLNFGTAEATNVALSLGGSELEAGQYQLQPLLREERAAPLSVTEGGGVVDYVPLPSLAPQTGYVFKLSQ